MKLTHKQKREIAETVRFSISKLLEFWGEDKGGYEFPIESEIPADVAADLIWNWLKVLPQEK